MRTTRVPVDDGVDLTVDRWGNGTTASTTAPTFVLLHGLASNARLWDGVAARLVDGGHGVMAVDLRGHGRSSKPDGPYAVSTVADDVAALIAGLGLGRPVVVGQSWGGNVALELAARHPGATRGIVCVDGGWLEPSRTFPDWEACRVALAPPRLAGRPLADVEGYIRAAHPDWPETGIQGTLANFEVRADGTIAPWLTYERHMAVLHGLWDHHPSKRYPALAVPVLLLPVESGEDERAERKRREIAEAVALIPTTRVRWFSGDHDIHAQHPDELAATLLAAVDDGFFR